MAQLELLTSTSPAGLLDRLTRMVAEERDAGWCIVVPRTHLARDVTSSLLAKTGSSAWIGSRVLTMEDLVAHYARKLDAQPALTPLQVRQLISAVVLELHEESGGAVFGGQVIDGRVSEAVLRSLTRLFAELEPFRWSADDLQEQLVQGGHTSLDMQDRAWQVAQVYRRYMQRIEQARYQGPQGRAVTAAETARTAEPPEGVRRFLFLGLDTSGLKDVGVRTAYALARNKNVERVVWALVLPEKLDVESTAWETHGNTHLYDSWAEDYSVRTHLPCEDHLKSLPADLAALALDPFAYRLPAADATGAVRAIRVPDTQLEVDWVATDIKRRILDDGMSPERIAIIARDMDERAEDFERALEELGVPVVSSREVRIHNVPAVAAMLALFRLPAFGWRVSDMVSVAESPYLATGLHPTLLARIGGSGTTPEDAADWKRRIAAFRRETTLAAAQGEGAKNDLPAEHAREAAELEERFDLFLQGMRSTMSEGNELAPSAWVAALVAAVEHWGLERQIYDIAPAVDRGRRALLARADLDGLNALIRAAHDWQAGREIAGLGDEPMSARQWYAELEAIAAETWIRSSTFPREAVQLLLPAQASLRQWDVVYVVGLVDGVFPVHAEITDHTLSEEERRTLHLPTTEQRAARERLLFHLSVATAAEKLILVAPAADDRGKALVTSPFLTCLPLRVNGLRIEQVTARDMVPASADVVLKAADVDQYATGLYRTYTEQAAGGLDLEAAVRSDPVVEQWLARPTARRATEAWAVERLRETIERRLSQAGDAPLKVELGEFVGLIPEGRMPAWILEDDATFSPSEIETYERCNFRFFATRLLGLGRASEQEEEHDEAAAFGTLQHRILEKFYGELMGEGVLPPVFPTDVGAAIERLEKIALNEVKEYMASAHERLWALDFDFVVDVLRDFVRRDLMRMLETEQNDQAERVRTRLVALETRVGPVPAEADGQRFQLRGKIDRIEEVVDDRLPAAAQGWLMIHDYKSTSSAYAPKPEQYLSGKQIQLPLYAHIVAADRDRRVFGFGELRTSQGSDPRPFTARDIVSGPDGDVCLAPVRGVDGNPIAKASAAALEVAAAVVGRMRNGRFAPQPKRQCFGCPFREVCRASTIGDPARMRARAQMPLAVESDAYAAAEEKAAARKAPGNVEP